MSGALNSNLSLFLANTQFMLSRLKFDCCSLTGQAKNYPSKQFKPPSYYLNLSSSAVFLQLKIEIFVEVLSKSVQFLIF